MPAGGVAEPALIADDGGVGELGEHRLVFALEPGQPIQHVPSVPGGRLADRRDLMVGRLGASGTRPNRRPGAAVEAGGGAGGRAYTPVVSTPPGGWTDVNRRMWDERVPLHVASRLLRRRGIQGGTPAGRAVRGRRTRGPGRPAPGPPAVPFRAGHPRPGADASDPGRRGPGLLRPAVEAAGRWRRDRAGGPGPVRARRRPSGRRRPGRPAPSTSSTRARGPCAGCRICGRGPSSAPACSARLGGCTSASSTRSATASDEDRPIGQTRLLRHRRPSCDETVGTYADLDAAPSTTSPTVAPSAPSAVRGAPRGRASTCGSSTNGTTPCSSLNCWLVRGDDGRYRWPGPGRLPLMYSLKAQKPE